MSSAADSRPYGLGLSAAFRRTILCHRHWQDPYVQSPLALLRRILHLASMQRLTTAQEDRRVSARKGRRAVAAAICRHRDRSIAVHHHRRWGGRWGSSRLWKLVDADTDVRISGLHDGGLQLAAGSMHRVYRACKRHTILLGGMHVHAHHRSEWAEQRQRLRPELLGRGLAVVRSSGQLLLVK